MLSPEQQRRAQERQLQVIALTEGRFDVAAIAAQLGVSPYTVKGIKVRTGVSLRGSNYTAAQIAGIFGVHGNTVSRWIRGGALVGTKPRAAWRWLNHRPVSQPWLVTEDDLLVFLETSPFGVLSITPAKITDLAWREWFAEHVAPKRPDWLNNHDLARRYNVVPRAVNQWRRQGVLPRGVMVGNRTYNHVTDLDGFIPPHAKIRQLSSGERQQIRALAAGGIAARRIALQLDIPRWHVEAEVQRMKARKAG